MSKHRPPSTLARTLAAQAWTKRSTRRKRMDPVLADAFAEIIDQILRIKEELNVKDDETERVG